MSTALTHEGTSKHELLKWSKYEDVCRYGIIPGEWEAGKGFKINEIFAQGEKHG